MLRNTGYGVRGINRFSNTKKFDLKIKNFSQSKISNAIPLFKNIHAQILQNNSDKEFKK